MKATVKKTIDLMTEARQNGAELIAFPVSLADLLVVVPLFLTERQITGSLGQLHFQKLLYSLS
jgi:hypothetical protein